MIRLLALALLLLPSAAFAHPGHDESGLVAGLSHPLTGIDHIAVMIAVGLWAALKGGRALWVWPAAFVGVMLVGGALGMTGVALPFVEPGILASVVVLGLLVALAVDLPVWLGAAIVGLFALFHGHAHGAEVPEAASGLAYMAGFAVATAVLHGVGIAVALSLKSARWQPLVRVAGAACALVGVGLAINVI
ncbi:HupE/UreJ family protein [Bradyrhizobium prioriisuperbiae]|uniref:HupE/UreJ family protein n=1 Tax=Bradyrhizobium prioriisuperbiae TaxID=2854389 RepID=UPI0028E1BA1C|nr:HupE/UreJ family protein [Bradyrhizobium prioritasuperba]